ncbi:methanethiol S-methyltransferase [Egicoccus sp. AB-alg2]|uniref:methanethiol S-methyltransferase n=1 Tax=Egicoccus sp. AB-alg2 TaxID=3242693 RepID=UPI00359D4752
MRRLLLVGYGALAYLLFLGVFAYTVGFLANAVVPRGIDEGPAGPLPVAIAVNAALLGLFAVQHTVMARPGFKRWWTRFVPPSIERSTFVLAASLSLVLVVRLWQPMPETVWPVESGWLRVGLWGLYGLGWVTVVGSTFMIDHFELFGLSQVVARARERAHVPPPFRLTMLYAFVRHPIMVGFLIAFWATPDMSQGRLLFAALGTGYILLGVRFEERDLRASLGDTYRRYEAEVPRFVPRFARPHEGAPVDDGVPVAQDG